MSEKYIDYIPIGLFFNSPIKTSYLTLHSKQSLILSKELKSGKIFYGEVPLLPEFGTETLEDIELLVKEKKLPDDKFPALNFGFSQLQLAQQYYFDESLRAKRDKIKLQAFLGSESIESDLAIAEKIKNNNFDTVKIKVGKDIKAEIVRINEIVDVIGSNMKLRLDPNGAWELEEFLRFQNQFSEFNIEYIEQPVLDMEMLLEFANYSSIPIAADESIRSKNDAVDIINGKKIKHFVLKPTFCGGYYKSKEIINLAEEEGINVVISSAYETNLGKEILVLLAANMQTQVAHGLGNGNWFSNDIKSDFFVFEKNFCNIFKNNFNKINFD